MEEKSKKSARKSSGGKIRMSAGHSPAPHMEPACGHSKCGVACRVAYVGPTSHPRDHHVLTMARGSMHVWSAAIVVGLAVVLTGAVAFQSVRAQEMRRAAVVTKGEVYTRGDMMKVMERLDQMEKSLKDVKAFCGGIIKTEPSTKPEPKPDPKPVVKPPTSTTTTTSTQP
jgi:hypothetical protein